MSIHEFPTKKKHDASHIARVDLIPIAAFYYKYIQDDSVTAQSLFTVFAAQAPHHAAVELTQDQYKAFKIATKHITETVQATYNAYLKEAEKYTLP